MKTTLSTPCRPSFRLLTLLCFAAMSCLMSVNQSLIAAETQLDDADKAWQAVEQASRPPTPPAEWRTTRPSQEEIMKFRESQGKLAGEAADKAKDFYTRFPKHDKADDARKKEYELTAFAVQLGNTNRFARLEVLQNERLKDPKLGDDERFELRTQMLQMAAMRKQSEGEAAMMAEFEKGVRVLQKDFPKRDEVYGMLLEVASSSEGDKARQIAQEIVNGAAPTEIKDEARKLLKKMEAVGKPLPISFTAVDGRKVDLTQMPGKVVLVDFWATWCGPCVAELPNVKAAYDKLHPKGFEIVGISFDQEKEKLVKFVAEKKMAWPQYFDGKGWENAFGKEYGISSIPAMWLVDKKGNLRDVNGRDGLAAKVEKLLAE
ncbi:MAG: TlpA family protein disulfide reductase [Verrucomicrobia bacterium]|nr:TlpA family protein disulfide reductase [Verrucomicrobiota bacterium]